MKLSYALAMVFPVALIIRFLGGSTLVVLAAILAGYISGTYRRGILTSLLAVLAAEFVPIIFYAVSRTTAVFSALRVSYQLLLVDLGFLVTVAIFGGLLGVSLNRLLRRRSSLS